MKHVVVTGGAGYVGSLLCPQLLALDYRVTAFDTCYLGLNGAMAPLTLADLAPKTDLRALVKSRIVRLKEAGKTHSIS